MMQRRTLFVMLLRRESGFGLLLAAAAVGAAAVYAATVPADPDSVVGVASIAARLLRRFDLAILAAAAVLVALRAAVRTNGDHAAAWVDMYAAAGGDRDGYAVALVAVITVQGAVLFLVGATGFGAAVYVLRGTGELLAALVTLAPAAILLIAVITAHTTLIGLWLREPLGTLIVAGALAVGPYIAATTYMARHDPAGAPLALRIWLDVAVPLAVASGSGEAARQVMLLGGVLAGAVWVARRYAGRRP